MKKNKKWVILRKNADYEGLSQKFGLDPLTIRLMVNRGISPEDMEHFLYPTKEDFLDPHLLHDGEKAAEILMEAVKAGQKIRVIGDYDIDGIMSTYILHQGILRVEGDASWAIPHRVYDGYGLSIRLVEEAKADGIELIITCDNGIAARDAIARGRELGMKVIVTDHHGIPFEEVDGEKQEILPDADAIINPHLKDCAYPFKDLCGAAVAWKFIYLLYEKARIPMEEADRFLENAAFATMATYAIGRGESFYR